MKYQLMAIVTTALLATGFTQNTTTFAQTSGSLSPTGETVHHPVRVLLVTGGHPYDQPEFHAMFDAMDDMTITHREIASYQDLFGNIDGWSYDTIVLFNMTNELFDQPLDNMLKLTEWGVGFVPLHHGTLSWNREPQKDEIFGVQFPRAGDFGFHIGQTFTYNITDPNHPITEGMEDFEIIDETYTNYYGEGVPGNRVLITTEYEPSDPELLWVRELNNSRIANIQGGHDRFTYANENFQELIRRSILWTSGRLPKEVGGEGLADTTIYRSRYEKDALLQGIDNYDPSGTRQGLVAVEDRLESEPAMRPTLLDGITEMVLSDSSNRATRHWGLRLLGREGRQEDMETIAVLLGDDSVGQIARYALEQNTSPNTHELLRDGFERTSGDSRRGIAFTLGRLKDKKSVPMLIELLSSSDSADVDVAASALAFIGGSEAGKALQNAHKSANSETIGYIEDSLLTYAEDEATPRKEAADLYRQLSVDASSTELKAAGWRGILLADGARTKDLTDALNTGEPRIRDAALRAIPAINDDEHVDFLASEFSSFSEEEQLTVLYKLEERGDSDTLPIISGALDSTNENVVANAIYVGGSLGNAETAKTLLSMADGADATMTDLIHDALATIPDESVDKVLLDSSKTGLPEVRTLAINSLTARRAFDYADQIFVYTEDEDRDVQKAAYDAISFIGNAGQIEALINRISTSSASREQRAATGTLMSLLELTEDKDVQLSRLAEAVERSDSRSATFLIQALASMKTEGAQNTLMAYLKSDDESRRLDAIRQLSEWPNAQPIVALLEIAQGDNLREATLASRGYLKLLSSDPMVKSEDKLEWASRIQPFLTDQQAKSQFISIVSGIPNYRSLEMVQLLLDDSDVQKEVVYAIVNLAAPLSFEFPEQVKGAFRAVIESETVSEDAKEEARSGLKILEAYGDRVVANWAFTSESHGWNTVNHANLSVKNGALVVEGTGEDPYISTKVEIDEQPLLLEFRIRYDDPGIIQFFMNTDKVSMGEPDSFLTVTPRPTTGDWMEYQIPFTPKGNLKEFRMDTALRPQTVEIDYIRILKPE